MTHNLLTKGASKNIKYLYMRELNTLVISVTQNLLNKGASRNIKYQNMRMSNNLAINVTIK